MEEKEYAVLDFIKIPHIKIHFLRKFYDTMDQFSNIYVSILPVINKIENNVF